ncbi:hypothetical protein, partial [uncultured Psychrobacter sp.]|uniref:hypothetical protein n=1 Tax=uncultured Psychrobacter sp. TaxID=259303 RepID=UPI0030DA79EF
PTDYKSVALPTELSRLVLSKWWLFYQIFAGTQALFLFFPNFLKLNFNTLIILIFFMRYK